MSNKMPRSGLTVVVTGASSGFGKGIVKQLSAEGANVVLAARRTGLIEELARECGPNAVAVTTDISKEEDIANLYETAISHFGKIDVWINNAALGIIGSFTKVPLEDLVRLVEINILGTMYGSHYALNHFKEQGRGTLINMSSFVSKVPLPYGAIYTGTKAAITSLSEGLYQEMKLEGRDNIHVCVVHPWVTDTPWTEHTGNYSGHDLRFGPVDNPETVIGAVIGLIDKPQESIDIGFKVKGTLASYKLMPGLVGKLNGASLMAMLQSAPAADATSGSLHIPQPGGTEVSGDLREKLKRKLKGQEEA
ncbi:SDR family oxidoreductase [Planomicrobium sp. CPCC 101079]|uniref:SDR family NAD(P)-dependent oxidoreductase n=1 Tax=Planomicrobium sp. CPCC 101079 TaxID=2599618 RepID=UPI0011B76261|nr:SDR family NAD(P)-dependent oxidoreductase [Planomicrobium sp. CPCC 101079]TWT01946.1 SDR family NAD(P)-dependent oxidoreductase [Planomicrobium sp. CPCC 101079]